MRDSPSGKSEQAVERNSSPRASQISQPECHNEIFPTTDEVGDCPFEEEGGDGEEEEEPAEKGKGN